MNKPHYPTLSTARLTSPFGMRRHPISRNPVFHFGIDLAPQLAGTKGVPVYAVRSGVVTERFFNSARGNTLRIKHDGEDISTGYQHLAPIAEEGMLVKVGDRVKQGQRIGTMGTTGGSTGIHLHFEVVKGRSFTQRRNDYLDPKVYLDTSTGLSVDGKWGNQTTLRFQDLERLSVVDGRISNQWKMPENENLYSAIFNTTRKGSNLIRHIQRQLGVKADGLCGPITIRAMQRAKGTPQDGFISEVSMLVRAIQRDLNAGRSPFGR